MATFNKRSIAGLKNYPIKDGGWLSPDGDYYPAPHKTHDAITALLSMAWYGEDKGGRARLERNGWACVKHDGVVLFQPRMVTVDQVSVLIPLLELAPNEDYHDKLLRSINRMQLAMDADAI